MSPRNYGLMEMSAVKEVANIGLGHATTALSELTGHSFNMDIPEVEAVALEKIPETIGDAMELFAGVYMPFEGDVEGHMAFVFPWPSAVQLWTWLLGSAPDGPEAVDELAASAMLEVGNILNSNFLNAISNMTNLSMHATPPLVSIDLGYSMVASIVANAEMQDVVALAVETRIFDLPTGATTGYFLCIPTRAGLDLILSRLGVLEVA